MAKLEIKNITKKFGDFYAANNITFTAEEGEFVTLLGPSGCGKTSLLKLIAGFHVPDEGEILYAIAIANDNQWDYLPAYNDLLPSTIAINFLIEVSNADKVVIRMDAPLQVNTVILTDDITGAKYKLGISNGAFYYEEVEE